MRRISGCLIVLVSGCVFAHMALGQEVPKFESVQQAAGVFQSSTDDAVRTAAYEWLKAEAEKCTLYQINGVFPAFGSAAKALNRREEFVAVCNMRAQEGSKDVRQDVLLQLSSWYAADNDFEKALIPLQEFLADQDITTAHLSTVAQRMASVLGSQMSRYSDAVKVLADAEERVGDRDGDVRAALLNAQAGLLSTHLGDVKAAREKAEAVLALGDKASMWQYSAAVNLLVAMDMQSGNQDAVLSNLMLLLKHREMPPTDIARRIADAGAPPTMLEECVKLLRERMTDWRAPDFNSRLERVQNEVIELLSTLGRFEEALGESRVFLFAASDGSYQQAANLTAKTLKALDGNLGRMNAFLAFQSADAESGEAGENVIMTVPALHDEVRKEGMKQLTEGPQPGNWNAWLVRSTHLLWLDRPADALDAAAKAFALCPVSENNLQTCAAAVTRPLLVATRDPAAAQKLLDYLLWGAAGRDGKAGTNDDLKDPFPEARRTLQLGAAGK